MCFKPTPNPSFWSHFRRRFPQRLMEVTLARWTGPRHTSSHLEREGLPEFLKAGTPKEKTLKKKRCTKGTWWIYVYIYKYIYYIYMYVSVKKANTLKHQDKLQVQLPRSACFLFSQGVGASLSWFSLWDWSPKFRSASTLADQKDKTASMWQAGKFHAMGLSHPKAEGKNRTTHQDR